MADNESTCVGCCGSLHQKDFMSCKECKQKYDLQCANLSPKRFRSFNEEKKRKWLCPECICKRPKKDNSDTPVRSTHLQRPVSPSRVVHGKSYDTSTVTSVGNVTVRKKSPASSSFITEERVREMWREDMKHDLKSVVDSSVHELSGQLKVINGQCAEFQASLSYVCKQYDDLRKELSDFKQLFGNSVSEIKGLKEENKSLKKSLQLLEEENLKQQQWARIQNVEITGIPEQKGETTTDLVMKVTEHIGVTIQPSDIEFAHRVQPRRAVSASHARPIVVRLRQRVFKDQMIAAARKNRDMTTKDVGIGGDAHKIFVNEHLTKDNKMLLGACKQRAKEAGYMYIWTKNCRIFVRRNENSPPVPINSSADLTKIV